MIQILHPGQFEKAAERLQRERMGVRRSEAHLYAVTNKTKGVTYNVRFICHEGNLFASCDCPAGIRHGRHPLVCKHLAAVVLYLRVVQQMRRGQ